MLRGAVPIAGMIGGRPYEPLLMDRRFGDDMSLHQIAATLCEFAQNTMA